MESVAGCRCRVTQPHKQDNYKVTADAPRRTQGTRRFGNKIKHAAL